MNRERIANLEINIDSHKNATSYYLRMVLEKSFPNDVESMEQKFIENYDELIEQNIQEGMSDLERFYVLIRMFKPALSTILELCLLCSRSDSLYKM